MTDVLDLIGAELQRAAQRQVLRCRGCGRVRRFALRSSRHDGRARPGWRDPRWLGGVLALLLASAVAYGAAAAPLHPQAAAIAARRHPSCAARPHGPMPRPVPVPAWPCWTTPPPPPLPLPSGPHGPMPRPVPVPLPHATARA